MLFEISLIFWTIAAASSCWLVFKQMNAMSNKIGHFRFAMDSRDGKIRQNRLVIKQLQELLEKYKEKETNDLIQEINLKQPTTNDSKLMQNDKSYTLIRNFLQKHDREVMYVEQVGGVTERTFKHPNPPMKAMAHKLLLFTQEILIKHNKLKKLHQELS